MKTVKIVSYNIRHGLDASFDMRFLANTIKCVDGDVVGLQEVDMCADRSKNKNQVEELKACLGWEYGEFLESFDISGGKYGTAVVSKYPIENIQAYKLCKFDGGEQRMLGVYTLNFNSETLVFANTHLDFISQEAREAQILQINKILKDEPQFILTGDFNNSNMNIFRKIQEADFVLNENTSLVTFPASNSAIDNIVYRGNIKLKNFGTIKESYSDHYMLWAEMIIN